MKRLSVFLWIFLLLSIFFSVVRDDYYPIGLWAERQGVLPEDLYNVNNIFPCMGLYDDNGQDKAGITDLWQNALP